MRLADVPPQAEILQAVRDAVFRDLRMRSVAVLAATKPNMMITSGGLGAIFDEPPQTWDELKRFDEYLKGPPLPP